MICISGANAEVGVDASGVDQAEGLLEVAVAYLLLQLFHESLSTKKGEKVEEKEKGEDGEEI